MLVQKQSNKKGILFFLEDASHIRHIWFKKENQNIFLQGHGKRLLFSLKAFFDPRDKMKLKILGDMLYNNLEMAFKFYLFADNFSDFLLYFFRSHTATPR